PHREPQRRPPVVETSDPSGIPERVFAPQLLSAVNRRKGRRERAHAAAGDDVDFDARFVKRAQHSCVIGAGGTCAGEDDCGEKLWRVRFGVGQSPASSCMVTSLTISNSRLPPGVATTTESPTSLFRNARPIGDVVEIKPLVASASSGMTSW